MMQKWCLGMWWTVISSVLNIPLHLKIQPDTHNYFLCSNWISYKNVWKSEFLYSYIALWEGLVSKYWEKEGTWNRESRQKMSAWTMWLPPPTENILSFHIGMSNTSLPNGHQDFMYITSHRTWIHHPIPFRVNELSCFSHDSACKFTTELSFNRIKICKHPIN